MTIPQPSTFPEVFDTEDNLFTVHDGLRVTLAQDYNPGDTTIHVTGDALIMSRFPPTGLITLTEQCSDIDKRAISFYYSSVDPDTMTFNGLEILPYFPDVIKPALITHVTQNVMDWHHNYLKDAVKAIQAWIGEKGTIDTQPFGPTLEGRINFLRKLVLVPKAWFTINKHYGVVPLEVEVTDRSFRLGTDGTAGPVTIRFDFGDNTSQTITTPGETVTKTYLSAGIYTITMTVTNDFGEDVFVWDDVVHARVKAPDAATIHFVENTSTQRVSGSPPVLRSPVNTLIKLEIPSGENPSHLGYSYAGEQLDEQGHAIDPIVDWVWDIADDLTHESASTATASFSVGGIYDVKLRTDTTLGAYRITTEPNVIDIVENTNLWLWNFTQENTVRAYEYGLISETFKLTPANGLTVTRNDSFLDNVNNSSAQKQEFKRNVGFAPRASFSGKGASALLYWSSGRNETDPVAAEHINVVEYQGFTDTYTTRSPVVRPWNWFHLPSPMYSYFFGGESTSTATGTSPVYDTLTQQNLTTLSCTDTVPAAENYLNGAQELKENAALYDLQGVSIYGDFSVYRTAWKDSTGYVVRNDAVGPFFRIKSFYMTTGSISNPVASFSKLADLEGSRKMEGGMTDMSQGIYFFDNSGSVSAFMTSSQTWKVGGPGAGSASYKALQDTNVNGYDSPSNTLLVASDKDKRAYISFDYSRGTFLKFTELATTFSALGSRPSGEQWIMAIY
jgi:PKD repeat protein